jgi:hypothetical protein
MQQQCLRYNMVQRLVALHVCDIVVLVLHAGTQRV